MKQCLNCNIEKSEIDFYKRSNEKYYSNCKVCYREKVKSKYNSKHLEKTKDYYYKNKSRILSLRKEYYKNNKDKIKQYQELTRIQINKNRRIRRYERLKNDCKYKLEIALRGRFYSAIRKGFKTGQAIRDLGCSIEELKVYLESKFQSGMNWDNYGKKGWHIDHIKPISKFNIFNEDERKLACHYTNLQPLWAKDNLKKSNKEKNLNDESI